MKNKYEIISNFLFPKFSQPKQSRFLPFFYKVSYKKKKLFSHFSISEEMIENGEDKRTSIVVKNIPKSLNKDYIKKILDGVGNINYLYLPFDKVINKNLGIAFINVVNYKNVINVYRRFNEFNSKNQEIKKPIEIFYSKIQGKNALSELFSKKY